MHRKNFGNAADLVHNLSDVSLGESFRFVAIRNVEFSVAIKSNDAIEARAVQEQEIQRIWVTIKAFPNGVVVIFA